MAEPEIREASKSLGAYEALARSARLSDLVAVAREVASKAARSRARGPGFGLEVTAAAEELKLERPDAETPFGNALEVLVRGPEDATERALACALWAHAVAESPRSKAEEEDVVAGDVLWLATHTAFDATSLLDRALGDDADGLWEAIAERVRRIDQGKGGALGRAEALVGAAALVGSSSARAQKLARSLARSVTDPALGRLLGEATDGGAADDGRLEGELVAPPRGPLATTALALTGLLFVGQVARLFARAALAYRRPAIVTLSDAGVTVDAHTELLGRRLRESRAVAPRSALARVTREVRYARAALYLGLLALAGGTYLGVRTFVDGVRSASPSLLLVGVLIVALGLGLDFLLGVALPSARGRVRVVFETRGGRRMCVAGVDAIRADALLARILRD